MRDASSNNKLLLWFMDNIEVPLANLCGHGDVKIARRSVIEECCQKAGLKVESCEIRKGMRMHCVVRKSMSLYLLKIVLKDIYRESRVL